MSEIRTYLNNWKEGAEALRKAEIPNRWEIERIQECIEGLFTFAKFQVGDSVEMSDDYPVDTETAPGWMSIRHLLRKGSKATIKNVDWYKDRFTYLIEFAENTWIDDKGVIKSCIYNNGSTCISISERWLKASKKTKSKK